MVNKGNSANGGISVLELFETVAKYERCLSRSTGLTNRAINEAVKVSSKDPGIIKKIIDKGNDQTGLVNLLATVGVVDKEEKPVVRSQEYMDGVRMMKPILEGFRKYGIQPICESYDPSNRHGIYVVLDNSLWGHSASEVLIRRRSRGDIILPIEGLYSILKRGFIDKEQSLFYLNPGDHQEMYDAANLLALIGLMRRGGLMGRNNRPDNKQTLISEVIKAEKMVFNGQFDSRGIFQDGKQYDSFVKELYLLSEHLLQQRK